MLCLLAFAGFGVDRQAETAATMTVALVLVGVLGAGGLVVAATTPIVIAAVRACAGTRHRYPDCLRLLNEPVKSAASGIAKPPVAL